MIKSIIKKYWYWPLVIIIAFLYFLGTAFYNYQSTKDGIIKWNSPDETANYIFVKLYGQENDLKIFEKYNFLVKNIIHPRSFRSDEDYLKPISFLGISLIYGKIVSLTSYKIIPYLTPFFGALGLIFYFFLVKEFFGRSNALVSLCLAASFPVYVYYGARSMFHNILFISLFLGGIYFLIKASNIIINYKIISCWWRKISLKSFILSALAGLFLGFAVITRTSEILWVMPLLIICLIFNIRQFNLFKILIFLSFFILTFLPVFYWNQILYGNFFNTGYRELNQTLLNIRNVGIETVGVVTNKTDWREPFKKLKDNIFYFGFYPRESLKVFNNYFFKMFFWIFIPTIIGFLIFIFRFKKFKKKHFVFLLSYVIISFILILYYGSWKFNDNPDPNSITIGNSYTRYWLPIYFGFIPFASLTINILTNILGKFIYFSNNKLLFYLKSILVFCLRLLILIFIIIISIFFTIKGSEESLQVTYLKNIEDKKSFIKVLSLTERNAVIITRYHDKLFFPDRKVIVGLFNDNNMIREYAVLVKFLPLYYYNFTLPEKDVNYLNSRKLLEFGLQIKKIDDITNKLTLYKIYGTK